MTIKGLWQTRATKSYKKPRKLKLPTKKQAIARVLEILNGPGAPPFSFHILVCFRDDTQYAVCERYVDWRAQVVPTEFKECAALVFPTEGEGDEEELTDNVCEQCRHVVIKHVFGTSRADKLRDSLDERVIYRNEYTRTSCVAMSFQKLSRELA